MTADQLKSQRCGGIALVENVLYDYVRLVHTARPVNDATEGSTQVAPMCASCVLPRKVDQIV